MLVSLVDPSPVPLRRPPGSERDLMIAAESAHVLAFDNLSGVSPWLSDALCMLSTGGGFSTRKLCTDTDQTLIQAIRPLILNGIDDLAIRGDLADRTLHVLLPSIDGNRRRAEWELLQLFEAARPRLLGALLDAVSTALRHLDRVELVELPRMADFAQWLVAAEPALPWEQGRFLEVYASNRRESGVAALEAHPVAEAVGLLIERVGTWEGTATHLLAALETWAPERHRKPGVWPGSADKLSNALRRAAPFLRSVGISVHFFRQNSTGRRLIGLQWDAQEPGIGGVTGVTGATGVSPTGQGALKGQRRTPPATPFDLLDLPAEERVRAAAAEVLAAF
jgi:hypothetical protein